MEQPGRCETRRLCREEHVRQQESVRTDGSEKKEAIRPNWLGGTAAEMGGDVTWKAEQPLRPQGRLSASRAPACDVLPRVTLFSLNSLVNNHSSEQSRDLLPSRMQR